MSGKCFIAPHACMTSGPVGGYTVFMLVSNMNTKQHTWLDGAGGEHLLGHMYFVQATHNWWHVVWDGVVLWVLHNNTWLQAQLVDEIGHVWDQYDWGTQTHNNGWGRTCRGTKKIRVTPQSLDCSWCDCGSQYWMIPEDSRPIWWMNIVFYDRTTLICEATQMLSRKMEQNMQITGK